jgi:hypothetical protein
VREAARPRLACLAAPAVQVFHEILKDKRHPHRLAAAKEVLERNHLYASGVEPPQRSAFQSSVTVQTQVNVPEARVSGMSDDELATCLTLLDELRALVPGEEPKRIGSVSR